MSMNLAKRMNKLASKINKSDTKMRMMLARIEIAARMGRYSVNLDTKDLFQDEVLKIADSLYSLGFKATFDVANNSLRVSWEDV